MVSAEATETRETIVSVVTDAETTEVAMEETTLIASTRGAALHRGELDRPEKESFSSVEKKPLSCEKEPLPSSEKP